MWFLAEHTDWTAICCLFQFHWLAWSRRGRGMKCMHSVISCFPWEIRSVTDCCCICFCCRVLGKQMWLSALIPHCSCDLVGMFPCADVTDTYVICKWILHDNDAAECKIMDTFTATGNIFGNYRMNPATRISSLLLHEKCNSALSSRGKQCSAASTKALNGTIGPEVHSEQQWLQD